MVSVVTSYVDTARLSMSHFLLFGKNKEPADKGQVQPPPTKGVSPHAETPAQVPASDANDATVKQAEVKKNKRERKEERQKNRKKEKKELKLENHQENAKGRKLKKCRKEPNTELEANGEETPKANGSTSKRTKKMSKGEEAADRGEGAGAEETKSAVGKRKRKQEEAETDSKKKKMKLAVRAEGGEPEEPEAPAQGKFNWKGTIKAVLKQAPDNEISIKKLRKKVLAQYHTVTGDCHKSEEELVVIFNKKISRNPTFRVLKDKVKLLK